MIRVTVELIPFGDEDHKKGLGIVEIINDGTGNHKLGNYTIYIDSNKRGDKFKIKKFVRKHGFWKLLTEVFLKKEAIEFEKEMATSIKRR